MNIATLAYLALLGPSCAAIDLRDQLTLTLSARETTLHERAPLDLDLVVHNVSACPARVSMTLSPLYASYFALTYRRPPGTPVVWTAPPSWRGPGEAPYEYLQLTPGEQRQFGFTIAADPGTRRFLFDKPGDFELAVRVQGRGLASPIEFVTNTVAVHAVPAPDAEAAPLRDFWDLDMAYLAQADNTQTAPTVSKTFARAEMFLARYPSSRYALAVKRGLQRTLDTWIRNGLASAEHKALRERLQTP